MGDFSRYLRDMQRSISAIERAAWMNRVAGETIRDLIKASFLAGKDPEGELWRSPSDETQFNGRWAASYRKRPSGNAVSADKIRLTDTGELVRSYAVLEYDANHVTVGPQGERNENIATRAETDPSEGGWGNRIAGWSSFRERIMELEVRKVWEHFAAGVPISRIRKPSLRAF